MLYRMEKYPFDIAPSILSANFARIESAIRSIEECDLRILHLDVMDGMFVPPITFGAKFVKDIRPLTNLEFDVHLMVQNPEHLIKDFAEAGANIITVHSESMVHLHRCLQVIKDLGIKAGVSIVPSTPVSQLLPILDMVDLVLVMTVNPGYGGQTLIQSSLGKVAELKAIREEDDYDFRISVDGGVNLSTIQDVVSAGADIGVCGSAFFHSENPQTFIRAMEQKIEEVK